MIGGTLSESGSAACGEYNDKVWDIAEYTMKSRPAIPESPVVHTDGQETHHPQERPSAPPGSGV